MSWLLCSPVPPSTSCCSVKEVYSTVQVKLKRCGKSLHVSSAVFIKLNDFLLRLVQVNSPSLLRPGSVEQYKRAFARQRARDLAQHADTLLSKDKEIAALQQECRELEARLGTTKVFITLFLNNCFTQPILN